MPCQCHALGPHRLSRSVPRLDRICQARSLPRKKGQEELEEAENGAPSHFQKGGNKGQRVRVVSSSSSSGSLSYYCWFLVCSSMYYPTISIGFVGGFAKWVSWKQHSASCVLAEPVMMYKVSPVLLSGE